MKEVKIGTPRLHYYKGLFLQAEDFELEAAYHVAARRYLNYLLFDAGVLRTPGVPVASTSAASAPEADEEEPATGPLAVTLSEDSNTTLAVAAGAAMVRDGDRQVAYEVRLDEDQDLPLAGAGFIEGETFYVTIGWGEYPMSGETANPDDLDAVEKQAHVYEGMRDELAALRARRSERPEEVTLAKADFHAAGITGIEDRRTWGGLRYEIFSDAAIAQLGTAPGRVQDGIELLVPSDAMVKGTEHWLVVHRTYSVGPPDVIDDPDGLAAFVWESDDEHKVRINDPRGLAKAISSTEGADVRIHVHQGTEFNDEATVRVKAPKSIALEPSDVPLEPGDTQQLAAWVVYDDESRDPITDLAALEWSPREGPVATVSPTGEVTAGDIAEQETVVAIRDLGTPDEINGEATVTVTVTPTVTITLEPPSYALQRNETVPLTAKRQVDDGEKVPLDPSDLQWESDDPAVEINTQTGEATRVSCGGVATITATSTEGTGQASIGLRPNIADSSGRAEGGKNLIIRGDCLHRSDPGQEAEGVTVRLYKIHPIKGPLEKYVAGESIKAVDANRIRVTIPYRDPSFSKNEKDITLELRFGDGVDTMNFRYRDTDNTDAQEWDPMADPLGGRA